MGSRRVGHDLATKQQCIHIVNHGDVLQLYTYVKSYQTVHF